MLKSFALLALLSIIGIQTQNTPKSISLTDKSNVSAKEIMQALQKECPNVSITDDVTKSDYALEARKRTNDKGVQEDGVNLTLFDREGKTFFKTSSILLGNAVKNLCYAINTAPKKK